MPEKVRKADAARYKEYWKMVKMKKKLQRKILGQGQPSQNRFSTQYHQGDPPWNGVERATPAKPRTAAAAEAVWRRGQSSQGCKTEGQKPQEYVRRSREDA